MTVHALAIEFHTADARGGHVQQGHVSQTKSVPYEDLGGVGPQSSGHSRRVTAHRGQMQEIGPRLGRIIAIHYAG